MRTLRGRITATTVVVAAVGLSLGAWGFARVTAHAVRDQLDRGIAADAQAMADEARDGVAPAALVAAAAPPRLVQVRRPDGTVLAASVHRVRQSADLAELDVAAGPGVPSGGGWVTGRSALGRLGEGWRVARAVRRGPAGRFEVLVAAPLADLARTTRTVRATAAACVPVLVGAIGALVWLALGRLLRPVDDLRRQAADAADVYPPPRLATTSGGAEIDALMGTLDALLQRSASGVRRQRRFLANAAHELLSPLTVLRTVLEVAQRRDDPGDMPKVLARSLEAQARLQQIAQQLLSLAHAEETGRLRVTAVDLAALVRAVAAELEPGAAVVLTTRAPGTLHIDGDRVALRQLVDNLARNAVRHAAGRVELHLRASRDTVVLDVDDDGPGVPGAHRWVVFEPFVRLDDARARGDGGAGLGLGIVHAVTVGHGGHVAVSDSPLGGARFRVVLPRRGAALTGAAPLADLPAHAGAAPTPDGDAPPAT